MDSNETQSFPRTRKSSTYPKDSKKPKPRIQSREITSGTLKDFAKEYASWTCTGGGGAGSLVMPRGSDSSQVQLLCVCPGLHNARAQARGCSCLGSRLRSYSEALVPWLGLSCSDSRWQQTCVDVPGYRVHVPVHQKKVLYIPFHRHTKKVERSTTTCALVRRLK